MKKFYFLFLASFFTLVSFSQNFISGNLVIYRVGTGATALSNAATPVFLDEYTPAGVLVRSIPMPTTASGSNVPLLASGTATSEGLLNRSTDGRLLVLTGYNTVIGTTPIVSVPAGTIPRVVGTVDFSATVNTTTSLTDFASGTNPRSAISTDGSKFWLSGGTGIRYALLGTSTSQSLNSTVNPRDIKIFQNQLYVSGQSGAFNIATVGTGLPTTSGQAVTNLNGLPTGVNTNQFIMFDLDASVPGLDVLYYADEAAIGGGIQKYSYVPANNAWESNGGVVINGLRGLTANAVANTVTLYGTTTSGLYSVLDLTGYNTPITLSVPVPIATAPANTAFRGIAFAPTQFILPVKFSTISVTKVAGRQHQLHFTNDTESDIARYEVERSSDGRTFTTLQNILPLKNDGSQARYLYNDGSPVSGLNVYRVKALELSGRVVYSALVKISDAKAGSPLIVFSNPVKGRGIQYQVSLQPGNYFVSVRSSTGQTVFQQPVSHSGGTISKTIHLSHAASGVYYLEISGPIRYTTSVVIE